MPEDFGYPVADHGHAGRAGDGAAGEADGVDAEKSAGRIQRSQNFSNKDAFPQPPWFGGPLEESGPAFKLLRRL